MCWLAFSCGLILLSLQYHDTIAGCPTAQQPDKRSTNRDDKYRMGQKTEYFKSLQLMYVMTQKGDPCIKMFSRDTALFKYSLQSSVNTQRYYTENNNLQFIYMAAYLCCHVLQFIKLENWLTKSQSFNQMTSQRGWEFCNRNLKLRYKKTKTLIIWSMMSDCHCWDQISQ